MNMHFDRRTLRTGLLMLGLLATGVMPMAASAVDQDDYDAFVERLGRQFDMQGEFVLRIMAVGIENYELAMNQETRDQVAMDETVCRFETPTGERRTHLMCRKAERVLASTNFSGTPAGGVDAAQFGSGGGSPVAAAPSSVILSYPVRERQLEEYIAMLPGLPEMNRRLVNEGMASRSAPEGLPRRAELDAFIVAYRNVGRIDAQYQQQIQIATGDARSRLVEAADAEMTRAINEAGLSQNRYNEIVEHVSTQPELFAYVRANYNN